MLKAEYFSNTFLFDANYFLLEWKKKSLICGSFRKTHQRSGQNMLVIILKEKKSHLTETNVVS